MLPAEPDVFEFSQFGITDWTPLDNGQVNNGSLNLLGPIKVDIRKNKYRIEFSAVNDAGIEWRFAPSQHIGALTPQLLYRSRNKTLANSFLSILPREMTGMLTDVDVVARMFTPDAGHTAMDHIYQGWVVACFTNQPSLDFYLTAIYRSHGIPSDVVSIWHVIGNSRIELVARQLGDRIDWRKPWHCRFNLAGSSLKAKWWSCDAIEPDGWDLQATDDLLPRSGLIGFASTVNGGIDDNNWGLDWYAWSIVATAPAPIYPPEIAG